MTPEIKAAVDAKKAASEAFRAANAAYVVAARAHHDAEKIAESAHQASVDASVALRNAVHAELGAEVTEVGLYHGDLWMCLDGQEMTYGEAVAYLAQRGKK